MRTETNHVLVSILEETTLAAKKFKTFNLLKKFRQCAVYAVFRYKSKYEKGGVLSICDSKV